MGFLSNFFSSKKNQQSICTQDKLKAHYILINGLYRNADGTEPTLSDFESKGFSENEFIEAVYGESQESMQNRLMKKYAEKRQETRKVMTERLVLNTKKLMNKDGKKVKSKDFFEKSSVNHLALFAPFGIYDVVAREGQMVDFVHSSMKLTGTALGLMNLLMGEDPYGLGGLDEVGAMSQDFNHFFDDQMINPIDNMNEMQNNYSSNEYSNPF